ncbi:MAG: hypothetical protein SWY16_01675 [Cyanobacteriota bacterium]|nr:hypothetical protein [Cyanobacteriota bacterium]
MALLKLPFRNQFLSFSLIGLAAIGSPESTLAESIEQRCENPVTLEDTAFCENREPEERTVQPTFSEEVRIGLDEKGFSSTFLGDALNGISDPLGGGSVGGDVENRGLGAISPVDRGLIAPFDPTDVIIPTPAVRK